MRALLCEIERAQRAAVSFDIATLEEAARQHLRLSEEIQEALRRHPELQGLVRPLQPALRRYSLLLKSSERLVSTISRVLDRGGFSTVCEI